MKLTFLSPESGSTQKIIQNEVAKIQEEVDKFSKVGL